MTNLDLVHFSRVTSLTLAPIHPRDEEKWCPPSDEERREGRGGPTNHVNASVPRGGGDTTQWVSVEASEEGGETAAAN